VPPVKQLRAEAKIFREVCAADPGIVRLCDTVEELLDAGYTLREYDGPQPRRWELLPEWGGKKPPEKP
jgi:hypothetical protein